MVLLEFGNIWWSTSTGKMYIYWSDGDTAQWTQTTPVGSVSTAFGSDDPIKPFPGPDGPDPNAGDDIGVIPETKDQKRLWWMDTTNFLPGDIVNFELGAPGIASVTEIAKNETMGTPDNDNGIYIRGYEDDALILPNGTLMTNDSRAVYQMTTTEPTNRPVGDLVKIENSSFDEVNGVHTVVQAG